MSITFNSDEIFEIAEEIERKAENFYKEASQNAPDEKTKKMLLNMAEMEQGHLETFREMRKQLDDSEKTQTVYDPDDESAMYLQQMARSHGIEGKKSYNQKITGKESITQLLDIAINAEKTSVVFYYNLKEFVPEKVGGKRIDAIIKEEVGHLNMLKLARASS